VSVLDLKTLHDIPPWEWPEDTAIQVLETLKKKDASLEDRLLAADLAGNPVISNEEIADALLSILKSTSEKDDLRSTAALSLGIGLEEAALGDFDDPEDPPPFPASFVEKVQRAFHDLYLDPGIPADLRRSALEASVKSPQNWHMDAVRKAYAGTDAGWKLTSIFCMSYIQGFEKEILDSLNSKDPDIHFYAIEAAGTWEIGEAWPHIYRLVTSKETEKPILLAAISATASIRPSEIYILEHLTESNDEEIAEAAMDAMMEAELAEDSFLDNEEENPDPDSEPGGNNKNSNG
jgi:hypothetical protein